VIYAAPSAVGCFDTGIPFSLPAVWGGRYVLVTRFFDMWSYRGVAGPSDRMFCIQVPVEFY
jgi:hypothetical protein